MDRIDELVAARVAEELTPVDVEAHFCELLDDCYSFDSVGGPFAHMLPSRVLRECDPVAFRCGVADFPDGQDWTYFGGEYYHDDEVAEIREAVEAELEAEEADDD